jgi:hypothetical protein
MTSMMQCSSETCGLNSPVVKDAALILIDDHKRVGRVLFRGSCLPYVSSIAFLRALTLSLTGARKYNM